MSLYILIGFIVASIYYIYVTYDVIVHEKNLFDFRLDDVTDCFLYGFLQSVFTIVIIVIWPVIILTIIFHLICKFKNKK